MPARRRCCAVTTTSSAPRSRDNGGTEVKHTGDGIMASFGTASSALGCAASIQQAFEARNETNPDSRVRVRIGLNAGEPVAEDGDLFGTAVQMAARICARAEPGQSWRQMSCGSWRPASSSCSPTTATSSCAASRTPSTSSRSAGGGSGRDRAESSCGVPRPVILSVAKNLARDGTASSNVHAGSLDAAPDRLRRVLPAIALTGEDPSLRSDDMRGAAPATITTAGR